MPGAPDFAWAQAPAAAPRQPSAEELSTARSLFDEGLKAEDRGEFGGALATYQRIAKITVSPVLLFRMAVCHGRLGHWVEAVNAFDLAALEADRAGRAELAAQARQGGAELRPKVPRLVIMVPADAQGVVLELDGRVLSSALLGTKILVDPGERNITVRAENYGKPFAIKLRVNEREEKTVRVELGERRAAAPVPGPIASGPSPVPVFSADAPVGPAAEGSTTLPWILTGVAVAAGLGAGATGLMAHDKHQQFEDANAAPTAGSLSERTALRDDGQTLALVSTLLTGAAVLSGGFAIYLFVDSRGDAPAPTPPKTAVAPWIGPDGAGLVARGSL